MAGPDTGYMTMNTRIPSSTVLIGGAALVIVLTVLMLPILETAETHEPAIDTFDSEAAFKAYLDAVEEDERFASETDQAVGRTADYAMEGDSVTADGLETQDMSGEDGETTTVQVAGIDEPDFVKTDGDRIFYTGNRWYHDFNTTVISDLPDMQMVENLTEQGELLIDRDTGMLAILEDDTVTAYRITGDELDRAWQEDLEHGIHTARMVDGQLVLVLSDRINRASPCPIRPMAGVSIGCTGIHYPGFTVDVDTTYAVLRMDAETGDVDGETAFVGSPRSQVYMTGGHVYVAYTESERRSTVMMDFLLNHASIDDATRDRLQDIDGYELSEPARTTEIDVTMERWIADNEGRAETIKNELEDYIEDRKRDIETTTLIRFDTDMEPAGEVNLPGRITDRMHLHEHGDGFAALTRIDPRGFPADRTNDLTLFDDELETAETVTDISDDRFPNVRFLGDHLYLSGDDRMTVHQLTDGTVTARFDTPYHYLHAISDDTVLAIGQERTERTVEELEESAEDRGMYRPRYHRNLSVTLLNVPEETVMASTVVDEAWTSVRHNMHAFQHDPEREQFFLPASGAAYLGDYSDGLELHTVNASSANRAFFIDDTLYTISRTDIRSFNPDTREQLSTLVLPERDRDYREPVPMPEPALEDDSAE